MPLANPQATIHKLSEVNIRGFLGSPAVGDRHFGRPRKENTRTPGTHGPDTAAPLIHKTFGCFGPEAAELLRDLDNASIHSGNPDKVR